MKRKLVLIRSDKISCSVMSDSLRPHELQHARPPCPTPTPGVCMHISLPFLTSLLSPYLSPPFSVIQSPCLGLETYCKFRFTICVTHDNVSFHVTLAIHLTLSSPLPMSINLFSYVCFSIAALQISSSVQFFWILYIYISI